MLVEKTPKLFGLSLKTSMIIGVIIFTSLIALAFLVVDDDTAKRQTLLQGSISIFCLLAYWVFLNNFEKSKK